MMEDMLKKYSDSLIGPAYECVLDWQEVERVEKETGQRLPDGDPRLKKAQSPVLGLQKMYRDWNFEGASEANKGAFAGALNRAFFAGDVLYEEVEGEDGKMKKVDVSWRIIRTLVGQDQLNLLNALRDLGRWAGTSPTDLSVSETTKVCWEAIEKFRLPAATVQVVEKTANDADGVVADADATDAKVRVSKFLARMTSSVASKQATKKAFDPHKAQWKNFTLVLEWIERKGAVDAKDLRKEFEAIRHPKAGKSPKAKKPAHKPNTQHEAIAPPTLAEQITQAEADEATAVAEKRYADAEKAAARVSELKAQQTAEAARAAQAEAEAKAAKPSIAEQIANLEALKAEALVTEDYSRASELKSQIETLKTKAVEESFAKGPSIAEQITQAEADEATAVAEKRYADAEKAAARVSELKAQQTPAAAPAVKVEVLTPKQVVVSATEVATAPEPAFAAPASAAPAGIGRAVMQEKAATELLASVDDGAINGMFESIIKVANFDPNGRAASIKVAFEMGNYKTKRQAVIRAVAGGIIQPPMAAAS
jgi:hypothetical protein